MGLDLASTSRPSAVKKRPKAKRPRKTHPKILGPVDDDTSSTSHNRTSPLLRLPPEIRIMIWRHALTSPTNEIHYSSASNRFNTTQSGTAYNTSLMSTCHQICLETMHLPLQLNTIVFKDGSPGRPDLLQFCRLLFRKERALGYRLRMSCLEFRDERRVARRVVVKGKA